LLTRIAQERQARWVVTGHTADDQAETVLHRLLRGTGLKGLGGIPARRPLAPGIELLRPLLKVSRAEVLAFLEKEGQDYRQDRSNEDLRFTRNRIRHELLPHLKREYNPAIGPILCRLAEQANEAHHLLEDLAIKLLAEVELPRAGALLVFDRARLAAVPRYLVREVFRLAWEREGWPLGALTFDDWDRIASVALGEASATDLPGRLRVRCLDRVIQAGGI
jgi:tRNA(Ile)-lysidine synthase